MRAGAEAHGRVFAIMYDISGTRRGDASSRRSRPTGSTSSTRSKLTASPRYLADGGKPVVIWGPRLLRPTPARRQQAQQLIAWFTERRRQPPRPRRSIGGVPTKWRTATDDSKTDAPGRGRLLARRLPLVRRRVAVDRGRYADDAGADAFATADIVPDLAAAKVGADALHARRASRVLWHNLNASAGGRSSTRSRGAGAPSTGARSSNAAPGRLDDPYTAMFDEVDEGTAMFKVAASAATLPAGASLVPLDADGQTLPSDFYLRLGGAATGMLRGDLPLTATLPVAP